MARGLSSDLKRNGTPVRQAATIRPFRERESRHSVNARRIGTKRATRSDADGENYQLHGV